MYGLFGSSAKRDQTKTLGPTLCCKISLESLRIIVVALLQRNIIDGL